jgi:hypothetical protein
MRHRLARVSTWVVDAGHSHGTADRRLGFSELIAAEAHRTFTAPVDPIRGGEESFQQIRVAFEPRLPLSAGAQWILSDGHHSVGSPAR